MRKHRRSVCLLLGMVFVGTWLALGQAQGQDGKAIGLRAGISDSRNRENFTQYEGFVTYPLPWTWRFASDGALGTYIEANAGALTGGGTTEVVASVGPGIKFQTAGGRINLWLGINPALISDAEFGDEDLGGYFQFTSHAGLSFHFLPQWGVGYRFQHMSNAGIYDANPGVNLHMLELNYRFE
ncbi:MAG: acyloxyacyl hydrolase [Desulfobacterales bacterium]|nr:MAG: acyloxyacyl hydrolase [Desulfobacterales bacterium]